MQVDTGRYRSVSMIQNIIDKAVRDPELGSRTARRVRNHVLGPLYHNIGREYFKVLEGGKLTIDWDAEGVANPVWNDTYGYYFRGFNLKEGDKQIAMVQLGGVEVVDVEDTKELLPDSIFWVRDECYLLTIHNAFLSPAAIEKYIPGTYPAKEVNHKDWVAVTPGVWSAVVTAIFEEYADGYRPGK